MTGRAALGLLTLPLAVLAPQEPPFPWEVREAWHVVADHAPPRGALQDEVALRLAAAELAVGRPARARVLLDRHGHGGDSVRVLALRAAVEAREGHGAAAGRLYARSARAAAPAGSAREVGILTARAAAAFERAGLRDTAAVYYHRAAAFLPLIADWLVLREAVVTADGARADSLLDRAPVAGRRIVWRARAGLRLSVGDSLAAERYLAEGGRPHEAARLAVARRDRPAARSYLLAALQASDVAVARGALALFLDSIPPDDPGDWLAAARAAARLGDPARAARWAARGVAAGDTAPAALLAWGDYLERAGRRREALGPYAQAGLAGELARGRALARLGSRATAIRSLTAFATEHADHRDAPAALSLAADLAQSDSLLEVVAQRWPAHELASRARLRLAGGALGRGDTVSAVRFYGDEVTARGRETIQAQFHVGRLQLVTGEPRGRATVADVARRDSLGYYGLLARRMLDLPSPQMAPPPPNALGARARSLAETAALLEATELAAELEAFLAELLERAWEDAEELLDVAEALIDAGRPSEGIRLGWRAASRLTLNHPRVVRVVFPWPQRTLIEAEASKFGVDPYLVAGLIRQESNFVPAARSRAGAEGVMQLMPATARGVAQRLGVPWISSMALVPDANVHIGTAHLAGLLTRYDGNPVPALAAYNAGGTPVARWLRAADAADILRFVEHVTYPETQGYLRAVLRNQEVYRALYGAVPAPSEP